MKKKSILLTRMVALTAVLLLASCGGGSGAVATSGTTAGSTTTLSGVANLGPVNGGAVTVTDLVTNQVVGTGTTSANGTGSFTVTLTTPTSNPVIASISGGTYIDEATGNEVPFPANASISACIPSPDSATPVAITPVTEIATQAALAAVANNGAGNSTNPAQAIAAAIDVANNQVGSALLGGANPVTTIPNNIASNNAGATATQNQYALVLAGLAADAAANGGDPYTQARALTSALFTATGDPYATAGAAVASLKTAVQNYTPPAGGAVALALPATTAPQITAVSRSAGVAGAVLNYVYVEFNQQTVSPTSVGQYTEYGQITMPQLNGGAAVIQPSAAYFNGQSQALMPVPNMIASWDPYGNWTIADTTTSVRGNISSDGMIGMGVDVYSSSRSNAAVYIVRKPTAITMSDIAGTYHIIEYGHDPYANTSTFSGDVTISATGAVSGVNMVDASSSPGGAPVVSVPVSFTGNTATILGNGAIQITDPNFPGAVTRVLPSADFNTMIFMDVDPQSGMTSVGFGIRAGTVTPTVSGQYHYVTMYDGITGAGSPLGQTSGLQTEAGLVSIAANGNTSVVETSWKNANVNIGGPVLPVTSCGPLSAKLTTFATPSLATNQNTCNIAVLPANPFTITAAANGAVTFTDTTAIPNTVNNGYATPTGNVAIFIDPGLSATITVKQ